MSHTAHTLSTLNKECSKIGMCVCVFVRACVWFDEPCRKTATTKPNYFLRVLAKSETVSKASPQPRSHTEARPGCGARERRRWLRAPSAETGGSGTAQRTRGQTRASRPCTGSRESTSCRGAWLRHTAAHVGSECEREACVRPCCRRCGFVREPRGTRSACVRFKTIRRKK